MCTYATEQARLRGSAKGSAGWLTLDDALVYVDHPYHTPAEHTLNIDFVHGAGAERSRVAVELTRDSAQTLVGMLQRALRSWDDLEPWSSRSSS